jgi:glycosidase
VRHGLAALACLALAATVAAAQNPPARTTAPDTSWVARSALYEVFVRDFSPAGTLRGVTEGLGRIQASGADVIWLMPVQPIGVLRRKDPLGSPYALRDYRAIDPAYGTAADFRALVRAAHARGLKVILDWVPDHTSWDAAWITEHPDWYVRDARGEISVPVDDKGKLTDWTDVAQLDYHNPELRRTMIATMRWWLEEYQLDGFRVDVAGFIPTDFWREAIATLRAAAPRPILLLAEWGAYDWHRAGFDLTYSWDSYSRLKAVWDGAPAWTFVRREVGDLDSIPAGGMRLRFTTNHDETAWDNPPVLRFASPAGARAAFVAAALLPGRPLLYNGQEVESPQKLGLFVRDAVAWDQPHAAAARAFYRRVLHLARTNQAFVGGEFREVETSTPGEVIAYRRRDVVVLVNTRPHGVRVAVSGLDIDRARDLLTNRLQYGDWVSLPAYGAVVLEPRAPTR